MTTPRWRIENAMIRSIMDGGPAAAALSFARYFSGSSRIGPSHPSQQRKTARPSTTTSDGRPHRAERLAGHRAGLLGDRPGRGRPGTRPARSSASRLRRRGPRGATSGRAARRSSRRRGSGSAGSRRRAGRPRRRRPSGPAPAPRRPGRSRRTAGRARPRRRRTSRASARRRRPSASPVSITADSGTASTSPAGRYDDDPGDQRHPAALVAGRARPVGDDLRDASGTTSAAAGSRPGSGARASLSSIGQRPGSIADRLGMVGAGVEPPRLARAERRRVARGIERNGSSVGDRRSANRDRRRSCRAGARASGSVDLDVAPDSRPSPRVVRRPATRPGRRSEPVGRVGARTSADWPVGEPGGLARRQTPSGTIVADRLGARRARPSRPRAPAAGYPTGAVRMPASWTR